MTEVNFSNIRKHKTSQEEGFEELCCQLLSLCPPASKTKWIRKDGSGGDAGVEGLWQLSNKNEICLQAKFFFRLETSQWRQIDESVSAMLQKHPKCTKYIICLPIDLSDGRKKGKKSQREKWDEQLKKWQQIEPTRKIEFMLWGAHELTELLTRNDPLFAGRRHYWFNETVLSSEWLSQRLDEAVANLGDRYTPEMHVELPIARRLNALVRTHAFWHRLAEIPKLPSIHSDSKELRIFAKDVCDALKKPIEKIEAGCDAKDPPQFDALVADIDGVLEKFSSLQPYRENNLSDEDVRALYQFESDVEGIKEHPQRCHLDLAHVDAIFLTGRGGVGKSHLLADLAKHCIDEGLPAVLLLGQQLTSGNPWQQILGALDFKGSADELLGALDAAGQANNARALFTIDALNEGAGNSIWPSELPGFAKRIAKFPYVTFIASCRSPFQRRIGQNLRAGQMQEIEHFGFAGHEEEAAQIFMDKRGIARPSAPLLAPEFSNPLFLSTVCKSLHRKGETCFPKGLNGVSQIFGFYFDSVCDAIEFDMGLDPALGIVGRAIEALVDKILATENKSIPTTEAIAVADSIHPSQGLEEKSLVRRLASAGVLTNDVVYLAEDDNDGQDVIRLTYERYLDHLRAKAFIDQYVSAEAPEEAFKIDGPFRQSVDEWPYSDMGFIEALSSQIPERFGRELYGLLEWSSEEKTDFGSAEDMLKSVIREAFPESLLARVPTATNQDTLDHLNKLLHGFSDESIDALVRIATEPEHMLNANLLHRNLMQKDLAERDELWSAWAAKNWYAPDDNERCTLWVLVHWAWRSNPNEVDDDRVWLACLTLSWLLSAPRRELRDKATKALVSIIDKRVDFIRRLLLTFDDVDDYYILERLYCAAYGIAMRFPQPEVVGPLARTVINRVFRSPERYVHILLRDYANGIVQIAERLDVLPEGFTVDKAFPPYGSEWPLEEVTLTEIEELKESMWSVHNSVLGFVGDFGTYTMKDVFKFSPSSVNDPHPASWDEVRSCFLEQLEADNPEAVKALLEYEQARRAEQNAQYATHARTVLKLRGSEAGASPTTEIENLEPEENAEELHQITQEKLEAATKARDQLLTEEQSESWRWMQGGHRSGDIAKFSRRKARRWIVKRVADLGWTKERFGEFEEYYCTQGRSGGHDRERMGKKYQWIAYHQLLARLADHCFFLEWNDEAVPFKGAWQLSLRDIDPSYLMTEKTETKISSKQWWETKLPDVPSKTTHSETKAWVRKTNNLPKDLEGLQLTDPIDGSAWLAIDTDVTLSASKDSPYDYRSMNLWINAAIVQEDDVTKIEKKLIGKNMAGLFTHDQIEGRDAFLGEYQWHDNWPKPTVPFSEHGSLGSSEHIVNCHIPLVQYYREGGNYDHSASDSMRIALPSAYLVNELKLTFDHNNALYRDPNGAIVWRDPWSEQHAKSAALIRTESIAPWLEANCYRLMWTVICQKTSVQGSMEEFAGELSDQQLVFFDGKKFSGHRWTILTEMGPKESLLRKPFKVS